ncbi:MAG TPA: peroxiredoxin [Candidatus Fraserbacteria bacterium]|nr:peroxiredoxin [Candidatus Fraserbacteria bacterium]
MSLVGQKAPDFELDAVVDSQFQRVKLSDYRGQYLIVFFYPMDFTFVCPTEIIAFADRHQEFKRLNTEVLAVSVDSQYVHLAWQNTPRKEGGIGRVPFPHLSDLRRTMARDYDVLIADKGVALRGLFIIDDEGIVQQVTINNLGIGRSIDETLRLLEAIQTVKRTGEVCPANWHPGEDTMKGDPQASHSYFEQHYK